MATTVTAPVGNTFSYAQKYLPILDEIYKREALTTVLDTNAERVRWIGAKTVNLFKTSMVGLSNYGRNTGFVPGNVDGSWEAKEIQQDRGRSYFVDSMDNDETLGMAFGTLVGETIRTKVVPEVDAYRFSKYAGTVGISSATPFAISSSTNIANMIDEAEAVMGDNEVPMEGRMLFVSETAYRQLKGNITRYVQNNEKGINTTVETYNGMRIIRVPQTRFYTGCQLLAPTTAGEIGGYRNFGSPIHFMIVHPSAVLQVVKHLVPRIFSPQVNQEADAWKFDYRIYHDCWTEDNKVNGIYLANAPMFTLSASTATVTAASGDSHTATVTVTGSTGTITVKSSDTTKATVSESSGTITITGVAAGTCEITVTDGNKAIGYIKVTVS